MKKYIISLLLVILPSCSAREVERNPETGTILYEHCGIYYISSQDGTLILGNADEAIGFCIRGIMLFNVYGFPYDKQYDTTWFFGSTDRRLTKEDVPVQTDDKGIYLLKKGIKTRPYDVMIFAHKLDATEKISRHNV